MYYPKIAAVCLAMAVATGASITALADDQPEVQELEAMGGPNSDEELANLLSSELPLNEFDTEDAEEIAGDLIDAINNADKNYGQGEKTLVVKTLLKLAESGEIQDELNDGIADDARIAMDDLLTYRAEGRGWGEILRTEYGIKVGDVMRNEKATLHARNDIQGGKPDSTLQHAGGRPEVSPHLDRPERPVRPEKVEKPVRPDRPDRPSRP